MEAAGERLACEAVEMVDPGLAPYPNPSPATCSCCVFAAPCLATEEGGDVDAVLAAGYRRRAASEAEPGRLGAVTWSLGRGAAPPRQWRPDPR